MRNPVFQQHSVYVFCMNSRIKYQLCLYLLSSAVTRVGYYAILATSVNNSESLKETFRNLYYVVFLQREVLEEHS